MNVQARCEEKLRTDRSFSLFPLQKKIVAQIQTIESGKKTFAKVSQRMFSEIMSAFTEGAEMDRNEAKKKQKPCFIFNQMLSRCVINRRLNRELKKHQEKTSSVNENEKAEVKLHAALVLNITY